MSVVIMQRVLPIVFGFMLRGGRGLIFPHRRRYLFFPSRQGLKPPEHALLKHINGQDRGRSMRERRLLFNQKSIAIQELRTPNYMIPD